MCPKQDDVLAGLDPASTVIHCIGIGGVGVSAIAEMLVALGFQVTGSDMGANSQTAKLAQLGVKISLGHAAANVASANLVVYSSAIKPTNPEFAAAQQQGLPLLQRAQMLAVLTMHHALIAVAGTHGKTTTTGMLVWVLHQAGVAPSFAVGGCLRNLDAYCQLTQGKYAVIEADESDASFLNYTPNMAILTNVDEDHLENYSGNYALLKEAYSKFLQQIAPDGLLVVCADNIEAMQLLDAVSAAKLSYGEADGADFQLSDFTQSGLTCHFKVRKPDGSQRAYQLNCPGRHNALNASAVIAIAHHLKIPDEYVEQALRSFSGMGRRFHAHGTLGLPAGGTALMIEDYGHHPRELEVTLRAAREVWPTRRIVLIFQPHRFSRVQHLKQEFARVLSCADALLLLDIYPAGEAPIAGVTSQSILDCMPDSDVADKTRKVVGDNLDCAANAVLMELRDQDICLSMGAGSVGRLPEYLQMSSQD